MLWVQTDNKMGSCGVPNCLLCVTEACRLNFEPVHFDFATQSLTLYLSFLLSVRAVSSTSYNKVQQKGPIKGYSPPTRARVIWERVTPNQTQPGGSFEDPASESTCSPPSGWKGREGERQAARLVPHSRLSGSRADILGLDVVLMTGLGAWDTGPTGDLQFPVDRPEPDSHPARVGL